MLEFAKGKTKQKQTTNKWGSKVCVDSLGLPCQSTKEQRLLDTITEKHLSDILNK